MAKVKTINVECTFTKSLPNYENIKPTAGVTIELEEGDSVKDVYAKAWDMVGTEIMGQIAQFMDAKKK